MARTTRSSQNSNKSSPPTTKASTKRSAAASSSPPAKRGRPSKKAKAEKVQKTIEETFPEGNDAEKDQKTIDETMKDVDGVEDDKDVAKQINGTKEENREAKGESIHAEAEPESAEQENRDAKAHSMKSRLMKVKPRRQLRLRKTRRQRKSPAITSLVSRMRNVQLECHPLS
jgi:hypothetical protein